MTTPELPDVLLAHRAITATGCWEWTRGRDENGYGRLRWNGSIVRAHRLVCHLAHGLDLTDRHQLARHRCDNPPCFNPDHIEPGTHRDNFDDAMTRGQLKPTDLWLNPAARKPRSTHCKRNHPFAGENVRVRPDGSRACRTCERARRRASGPRRRPQPRICPDCGARVSGGHMARHRRRHA